MPRGTLVEQIDRGYEFAHKTHGFDEKHDSTKLIEVFFQDSHEGKVMFVIFYTQACRWERCLGCNLPSTAARKHIDFRSIMRQVDNLFRLAEVIKREKEIRKIIVSNQGSILDEDTFSTTALLYLVAKCNMHLPNLDVFCLETRAEYVDDEELEILARALKEGDTPTVLEVAIGFEAFDDELRNKVFHKGLPLRVFEELIERLARHKFHAKCYFMFKPVPNMTNDEAIADIKAALDYLSKLEDRVPDAEISMHLNPTYAARGTDLEIALLDGTFIPPLLRHVVQAVKHAEGSGIPVFVGLDDEGLAAENGSFIRNGNEEDERLVRLLNQFNATQDFRLLDSE